MSSIFKLLIPLGHKGQKHNLAGSSKEKHYVAGGAVSKVTADLRPTHQWLMDQPERPVRELTYQGPTLQVWPFSNFKRKT